MRGNKNIHEKGFCVIGLCADFKAKENPRQEGSKVILISVYPNPLTIAIKKAAIEIPPNTIRVPMNISSPVIVHHSY